MAESSQTNLTREIPLATHEQESNNHEQCPKSPEGPFRDEPVLVDLTCDEVVHGGENKDHESCFQASLRVPHILPSPLPETLNNLGTDYTAHNLQYFLRRESYIPDLSSFRSRSPQLSWRPQLIQEILEAKRLFNLFDTTVCLAMKMVDFFMDSFSIEESNLSLLAMASLRLAAKFEDKGSQIPKISSLKTAMNEKLGLFQKSNFHQMEIKILSFFKFDINFPTTVQFLDFFSDILVDIEEDDLIQTSHLIRCLSKDVVLQKLRYYIGQFTSIYLQTTEFIPILPSLMGCAILFASRIAVGISPYWPERFIRHSGGVDVPQNKNIVMFSNYILDIYHQAINQYAFT